MLRLRSPCVTPCNLHWIICITFIVILAASPGITLAAIMGPTDDRRQPRLERDEHAFAATGQVKCTTISGKHSATAALLHTPGLGNRYFLTVGHAFLNPGTGEKFRGCRFSLAGRSGEYPVLQNRHGDVMTTGWDGDWAIGQLANTAGLESMKGFNLRATNPYDFIKSPVLQLQYDTESKQLLVAEKCKLYRMQLWNLQHGERIFIHDCDIRAGGSGGPMVVKNDGAYQIIGFYLGTVSRNRYYEMEPKADYSLFDPESFVNVSRRVDPEILQAIEQMDSIGTKPKLP